MRFRTLLPTLATITLALLLGVNPLPAMARQSAGESFNVDSVHSTVVFRIRHMGVSYFYGTFWEPTGTYALNFDDPSASSLRIEIDAATVDTGNERRNNHLKSPDFFDVKLYPTITFEATSFSVVGEGKMQVEGNLTMVGQTEPIEATLEFVDEGDTPQGYKNGFEANFSIKRSDWGMDMFVDNGGLGDEVALFVTVEGLRAK